MPETILEMYEGEDIGISITLTYSGTWSTVIDRGNPVLEADVDTVFFFIKEKESDTTAFIELTDADSNEIEWTDDGEILCKLPGADSEGHQGKNRLYEVRLKMLDGRYFTAKKGKIHIFESLVDRP